VPARSSCCGDNGRRGPGHRRGPRPGSMPPQPGPDLAGLEQFQLRHDRGAVLGHHAGRGHGGLRVPEQAGKTVGPGIRGLGRRRPLCMSVFHLSEGPAGNPSACHSLQGLFRGGDHRNLPGALHQKEQNNAPEHSSPNRDPGCPVRGGVRQPARRVRRGIPEGMRFARTPFAPDAPGGQVQTAPIGAAGSGFPGRSRTKDHQRRGN